MGKILSFIFLAGMLSSCFLSGGEDGGEDSQSLEVRFRIDNVSARASPYNRAASMRSPNEVIYLALGDPDATLQKQALVAGKNGIQVPKGFIYLFAFVYNPKIAGESGGIQIIGNLNLIELGLDSLPVSSTAQDTLELGTLELVDGEYVAGITGEYVTEVLGYSKTILLNYGAYDETTNRLLNPDINQDGIYDTEQNLHWDFRSSNSFHWYTHNFDDLEAGNTSATINQVHDTYRHSYAIILSGNLPHGGNNETYLEYESSTGWIQIGKVDDMTDAVGSRIEPNGSQWYVFENLITTLVDGQQGPWDGNYRINHPERIYYFYNMKFNQPYKTDAVFIFPFFTLTGEDPKYYDSIKWIWKKVQGEAIGDITLEELKLITRDPPNFGIRKIHDDSTFGNRYSAPELNVAETISLNAPFLRSDYSSRLIQVDLTYCDYSSTYYQGYNDQPF